MESYGGANESAAFSEMDSENKKAPRKMESKTRSIWCALFIFFFALAVVETAQKKTETREKKSTQISFHHKAEAMIASFNLSLSSSHSPKSSSFSVTLLASARGYTHVEGFFRACPDMSS